MKKRAAKSRLAGLSGGGTRKRKKARRAADPRSDYERYIQRHASDLDREARKSAAQLHESDRVHMKAAREAIARMHKAGCSIAFRNERLVQQHAARIHSARLRGAVRKAARKAIERRDAECWK